MESGGSSEPFEAKPTATSRAARAGMPVRISERAARMRAEGGFTAGPLPVYEIAGRRQLAALLMNGLYPSSKVLDVGCGSLRAGYWLMTFLEPGCYFGINPRSWEIDTGLQYIIEPELAEYAKPRFAYNDDFDFTVFDEKFDFVLARSIWTHTPKAQIEATLDSFLAASQPDGVLLASYHPASRLPESIRTPLHKVYKVPGVARSVRRLTGRGYGFADYKGTEWAFAEIGQRRDWLEAQCARRGLQLKESPRDVLSGAQPWAIIRRANSPGSAHAGLPLQ